MIFAMICHSDNNKKEIVSIQLVYRWGGKSNFQEFPSFSPVDTITKAGRNTRSAMV